MREPGPVRYSAAAGLHLLPRPPWRRKRDDMTDEAWIEQSIARLETLEAQKAELEASGQDVPAQLAEEIATLYEALESAAGDDEDEAPAAAAPDPAPAPAPAAASDDPFAAPAPAAAPVSDDPFAAPAAAAAAPAAASAAPIGGGMADYDYDDDIKPSGGKGGLLALAAVVVLGAAGGGYWYMNQQKAPEPAPEPAGEAKVISASSVPEDTQEPQAAQGADADRTEGARYKEGSASAKPSGKRPSGNGGGKRKPRKKKDEGRKVDLSDSRDPLAGI